MKKGIWAGGVKLIPWLAVLALILPLAACKKQQFVLYEMAELRRNADSVVETIGEGDRERSMMAIKQLKMDWSLFRAKYADYGENRSAWKRGLDKTSDLIDKADTYGNAGRMDRALDMILGLEPVLRGIRRENGIVYLPDLLHSFESAQNEAMRAVQDGELKEEEVPAVDALYPKLKRRWQAVAEAEFEPGLYGFSKDREKEFREQARLVTGALDRLGVALKSGDRKLILQAVRGIRSFYEEVRVLFSSHAVDGELQDDDDKP